MDHVISDSWVAQAIPFHLFQMMKCSRAVEDLFMRNTLRDSWPELAFDSWLFAGEAALVVWLRSCRMMMGGTIAQREAQRMVAEKIAANLTLFPAMLDGGFFDTPEAMGARALAHYRRPVAANRKRLARAVR